MLLLLGHGFVRTIVRTAVIESSSRPSAQLHGDIQQHYGIRAFIRDKIIWGELPFLIAGQTLHYIYPCK